MAQTMGLPSIIGRGAGCGLALYLNASAAVMQRSKSLSVTKVENFAGADDSALEICSASNASTRSWRDTETLNWLCFGSQYLRRTRIVLAARSGSKLIGYLAMKRWRGHSYYLLECRCREADPEIARQLIWAARGFAQQDGAQCIFIRPYSRMIEEAIPRTISITLSRPEMTYCYAFKAANVAPDNWEATPGDGDVSVN